MKEFMIIAVFWVIWFLLLFPLIDDSINQREYEEMVSGYYTTSNIVESKYRNLYSVKNLNISFKNGKYQVYYNLYSNCERYYTNSFTCADNNAKLVRTVNSKGNYSFSDGKLILQLEDGIKRTCTMYTSSINCSSSGGWNYSKIKY